MHANRLQLNTDKSELLRCTTSRRLHQLPSMPIRIGPDFITPSANVRDLGIHLDCDLTMRSHVRMTVASCFAVLRQLRSVRRSVPPSVYQTLVVALVLSKLDYGNATLIGLPACQYDRLQSVLNAAARSIAGLRRSDHITDTLTSFHWLRALQRVQFKLAVLTFRALHGLAPDYCRLNCVVLLTSPLVDDCGQPPLIHEYSSLTSIWTILHSGFEPTECLKLKLG
jgi:hypothetical protein